MVAMEHDRRWRNRRSIPLEHGEIAIHFGYDLLASFLFPEERCDLPILLSNVLEASRHVGIDYAHASPLQQSDGRARRVDAGKHEVRVQWEDFLCEAMVDRDIPRHICHVRGVPIP